MFESDYSRSMSILNVSSIATLAAIDNYFYCRRRAGKRGCSIFMRISSRATIHRPSSCKKSCSENGICLDTATTFCCTARRVICANCRMLRCDATLPRCCCFRRRRTTSTYRSITKDLFIQRPRTSIYDLFSGKAWSTPTKRIGAYDTARTLLRHTTREGVPYKLTSTFVHNIYYASSNATVRD